jgi:quercetin dioxygenase-like cupin family protein
MKAKLTLALCVGVLGAAWLAGNVLATPAASSPAPTTTILGRSVFGELNLSAQAGPPSIWQAALKTRGTSDLYVVDNQFAPGAATGWHSHPGPSLILVISGRVTNYMGDDPTCTGHTYAAGSGFVDPGGVDVHDLVNNGNDPAETIAVQLLPKDAPRKTPAPNPGNCPF